jgi:tetratricopeptide (TPR) repeat protein
MSKRSGFSGLSCLCFVVALSFSPPALTQGDYSENFGVSPQQMLQGVDAHTIQQLNTDRAALQRNPNDVNALVDRGALALNIADKSRYSTAWIHFAAKNLEKALTLNPNDFYAQHNYAMACYEAGDVNDPQPVMHLAVIHFNRALQLKPDSARTYMGRGWAYLMMDDQAHANADFQKALQLDPSLRDQLVRQANGIRQKRAQKGCIQAAMQRGGVKGVMAANCPPPPDAADYKYNPRAGGFVVK